MLTVLRRRNFALLWLGGLISLTGDRMLHVALPYYIYSLTGSALATGGIFVAYALPRLLLSSFAGVFVDRWDRKRTMLLCNLLQVPFLLLLLLVRSPEWVWLIYVARFAETMLGLFFGPAEDALLPRLVEEERLQAANALNALNNNIALLIGPPIGGALLGGFGLTSVVVVDGASFLLAAALIGLVAVDGKPSADQRLPTQGGALSSLWREWIAGLALVRRDRLLVAVFLMMLLVLLADGFSNVLLVVFLQRVLGVSALEYGWLGTAQGVGGLAAGIVIGFIGSRLSDKRLFMLGATGTGLGFAAMVNAPTFGYYAPLAVLTGFPILAMNVGVNTLLQRHVADHYRGRIFGTLGAVTGVTYLVGLGLASSLADSAGVVPLMYVSAAFYISAAVVALALLPRPIHPPISTRDR